MNKIKLIFLKSMEVVAEGTLTLYPDRMPIAATPGYTAEQAIKAGTDALLTQLLKAEQSVNADGPLRAHFEEVTE